MFRTSDIVLIGVMVAGAAFTYTTKHEAENRLAEVRKIERLISFERDTIDVLKADWSLLTQPSRLQKLAKIYSSELQLAPVEPHQIVRLDELPMRPLEIEDIISSERFGGESGRDLTTTGAVAQ